MRDMQTRGTNKWSSALCLHCWRSFHPACEATPGFLTLKVSVCPVADWLIDMGPEGGAGGGTVVGVGTPEELAANPASHTGRYLAPYLRKESE